MNEIIGIDIERAFTNWKETREADESHQGEINIEQFSKEVGIDKRTYYNLRNQKGKYAILNVLAKISEVSGLSEEELKIKRSKR